MFAFISFIIKLYQILFIDKDQEDGQWNIIESTIAQLLMKGVPVYVEKILKSTYV
jgi:heme/copper-type cytochrome/quinol oxidase subunit 4